MRKATLPKEIATNFFVGLSARSLFMTIFRLPLLTFKVFTDLNQLLFDQRHPISGSWGVSTSLCQRSAPHTCHESRFLVCTFSMQHYSIHPFNGIALIVIRLLFLLFFSRWQSNLHTLKIDFPTTNPPAPQPSFSSSHLLPSSFFSPSHLFPFLPSAPSAGVAFKHLSSRTLWLVERTTFESSLKMYTDEIEERNQIWETLSKVKRQCNASKVKMYQSIRRNFLFHCKFEFRFRVRVCERKLQTSGVMRTFS